MSPMTTPSVPAWSFSKHCLSSHLQSWVGTRSVLQTKCPALIRRTTTAEMNAVWFQSCLIALLALPSQSNCHRGKCSCCFPTYLFYSIVFWPISLIVYLLPLPAFAPLYSIRIPSNKYGQHQGQFWHFVPFLPEAIKRQLTEKMLPTAYFSSFHDDDHHQEEPPSFVFMLCAVHYYAVFLFDEYTLLWDSGLCEYNWPPAIKRRKSTCQLVLDGDQRHMFCERIRLSAGRNGPTGPIQWHHLAR